MGQRSVSPKGGLRENHKIRWPKIMSESQLDAWYGKVDKIRRRAFAPAPKKISLPTPGWWSRIQIEEEAL